MDKRAAESLVRQIAGFIQYENECLVCGKAADTPNPECEAHAPFVPSDPDDAVQTINSLIREARQIVAVP